MSLAADPQSLAVSCPHCGRGPRQRCAARSTGYGVPTHRARVVAGRVAAGEPVPARPPSAAGRQRIEHNRRLLAAARPYVDGGLTRQRAADAGGFTCQQISEAAAVLRAGPVLVRQVEAGTLLLSAALARARGRLR